MAIVLIEMIDAEGIVVAMRTPNGREAIRRTKTTGEMIMTAHTGLV